MISSPGRRAWLVPLVALVAPLAACGGSKEAPAPTTYEYHAPDFVITLPPGYAADGAPVESPVEAMQYFKGGANRQIYVSWETRDAADTGATYQAIPPDDDFTVVAHGEIAGGKGLFVQKRRKVDARALGNDVVQSRVAVGGRMVQCMLVVNDATPAEIAACKSLAPL